MPWSTPSLMSLRLEFVELANKEGANVRELCRRFRISPTTGQKWRNRFKAKGVAGLEDESRRPARSPKKSRPSMEREVLKVRDRHPAWGARTIHRWLVNHDKPVPGVSTVHAILQRNGRIDAGESDKHRALIRFERERPNQLWQMDFKGHFATDAHRCHPLTVLDDCSRFNLCLKACANEQGATVQGHLTEAFSRYGMPEQMLMDNGPPWGVDEEHRWTPLTVWLLRLGIRVAHGRPYHPQTQGKEERFHRTLNAEVLRHQRFRDNAHVQRSFNTWRRIYNHERPHHALKLETPASRYSASARRFPRKLVPIEYGPDDIVLKVKADMGRVSFKGTEWKVGKAFVGQPVAIRPTTTDGLHEVYFCHAKVASIDLRTRLNAA